MIHWNWAIRRPVSLGALVANVVVFVLLFLVMLIFPRASQPGNTEGRLEVLEEQQIREDQRINSLESRPAAAHDAETRITRVEDRMTADEAAHEREIQDAKDTSNHLWATLAALMTGLIALVVERILYRKKPNGG